MDFSESPSSKKQDTTKSFAPRERFFPDFEGYQIVEELPRGGQAFVYKAIQKATKSKVALKVLAPGPLSSAKARRRFEREVDLISGLKHPYIVSIRDSGISKGHYYYSMEYLKGLQLDQYISSQELSFRKTLELFAKICDATKYAHQHGVIHRDLKPSNILVDERGDPHILDFGLAKAAGSLGDTISVVSVTGEIRGTLAYMSPEQASGQSDLIDTRTDVYTLGVIFYELLMGQFPYDVSGTNAQILRNIERSEPKRPRAIKNKFDSEVEAIILKCLAKRPSDRYHSGADLLDDIQHWLNGEPLVAKSQSSIYILYKLASRHKYKATVVGLLMIIILSFSGILYYSTKSFRDQINILLNDLEKNYKSGSIIQIAFLKDITDWPVEDTTQKISIAWAMPAIVGPCKEAKGIHFLQPSNKWSGEENRFRGEFSENEKWFADLVIGERYWRRKAWTKAAEAYNRSFAGAQKVLGDEITSDGLLKTFVAYRLQQLKDLQNNPQGKRQNTSQAGGD